MLSLIDEFRIRIPDNRVECKNNLIYAMCSGSYSLSDCDCQGRLINGSNNRNYSGFSKKRSRVKYKISKPHILKEFKL